MKKYKLRVTRTVEDSCITIVTAENLKDAYDIAEHRFIKGKLNFDSTKVKCGHNIQMVNPKDQL